MPPKRKASAVKALVQYPHGVGTLHWFDYPLTPHENKYLTVLAYGMDDGTVRWKVDDASL